MRIAVSKRFAWMIVLALSAVLGKMVDCSILRVFGRLTKQRKNDTHFIADFLVIKIEKTMSLLYTR